MSKKMQTRKHDTGQVNKNRLRIYTLQNIKIIHRKPVWINYMCVCMQNTFN